MEYNDTYLGEVVETACSLIKSAQKHYYILTILIDDSLDDIETTKEQIILAEELPVSIIIIGMGKNDFTQMQEFD